MAKAVFLITLVLACSFQWMRLTQHIVDDTMWAHQAQYVQTGDPEEFNALMAYGHPGGPLIEGTILIHNVTGASYLQALDMVMAFLDGLFIAATCLMCFLLRKDPMWSIPVFASLCFSQFYDNTTPPSAVASLIVVFLCLLSIYIYENRDTASTKHLALWSVTSGILVATRVDIGIILMIAFAALIFPAYNRKKLALSFLGSFIGFCIFDPFMWFMPIKHIGDLVSKVLFHYSDIAHTYITFVDLLTFSTLAFISMFFAIVFLTGKSKIESPFSKRALVTLLVTTTLLYTVFLTAHSQAERYFQPIVFIWETLLPVFLLAFVPGIQMDFLTNPESREKIKRGLRIGVIVLLTAYPLVLQFYAFSTYCQLDRCWILPTPFHDTVK